MTPDPRRYPDPLTVLPEDDELPSPRLFGWVLLALLVLALAGVVLLTWRAAS